MKRKLYLPLAVVALGAITAIYFAANRQEPTLSESQNIPVQAKDALAEHVAATEASIPKQGSNSQQSEREKTTLPHCGCANCSQKEDTPAIASIPLLKNEQRSISVDDALRQYLFTRSNNQPVTIPLPLGETANGVVDHSGSENGKTVYIQGRLSEPAKGTFYFRDQSDHPGVAGSMVGVIRLDDGDIAYRVEPLGINGAPVLVEQDADDVVCRKFGHIAADIEKALADHPTNLDTPVYQNDVPPLESLPGSSAVVYLDFDGEEGPHESWGDFDAAPWPGNTQERINIWKRVAEDFAPFNINVTTDLQVYLDAPQTSRQRCIVTPTTNAAPGAGGVAFLGSFNWAGDVPCWSFNGGENNAAMTISHEIGHTLGLGHDGRTLPPDSTHEEYYGGHGSGSVSWGPIMGGPFGRNLTQWSKGEYANANRTQNDISHIISQNNATAFRTDDHSDSLASASYLDILSDNSVLNEGVIEQETDVDGFKFTLTSSGSVNLTASPEPIGPNLDILLEIVDSSDVVVATNNPDTQLNASISTSLAAGEYMVRVSGTGRGDVLGDGYSAYGSLGFYQLSGTVTNALIQQRFTIAENTANGTTLGTVTPNNNHGSDTISFSISSGNTDSAFTIDSSTGALSVANSAAIDFETLSTYFDDPAEFRLAVNITNSTTPALNETVNLVVEVTDVNEPHTIVGVNSADIYKFATAGQFVTSFSIQSEDNYTSPINWSITSGNTNGTFSIDSSGRLSVANAVASSGETIFNLQITATDNGPPLPVISANHSLTVNLLDWRPIDGIATPNRNWTQEPGVVATQSSDFGSSFAPLAIDGNTNGNWSIGEVTHTLDQANSWWQVDLGAEREIESIVLFNRTDCCGDRLSNFRIRILDAGGSEVISQTFYAGSGFVAADETWTLPSVATGQVVRIELIGQNNTGNGVLSLAEVIVNAPSPPNLAEITNWTQESGVSASQSSVFDGNDAAKAIDGITDGNFGAGNVTHTLDENNSWWEVDLGTERPIDVIRLFNRTDCCGDRLSNYRVSVLDASRLEISGQDFHSGSGFSGAIEMWSLPSRVSGRYVRVQIDTRSNINTGVLSLAEVQVLTGTAGTKPIAQQSTTIENREAFIAIDANTSGDWAQGEITHTDGASNNWWEVNLGQPCALDQITFYNRTDCCGERLSNFRVSIWNGSTEVYGSNHFTDGSTHAGAQFSIVSIGGLVADRVRIESLGINSDGNRVVSLAEVQVFGTTTSSNQAPALANSSTSIVENNTPSDVIATVTATDPDIGDEITYAITSGNSSGLFAINAMSGEITSTPGLDYETATQHVLTISATDNGVPAFSDTATLTINVTDVPNDDSDGDSLTDEWEVSQFGNTTSQNGADDPDGDLISNADEEDNGSDPNTFNTDTNSLTAGSAPIIGVHNGADLTLLGTAYHNSGAGNPNNMLDDDPSTSVDTWNNAGTESHSYVGITWPSAQTQAVRTIRLRMATFQDGGWFGVNNVGPGAGNALVDGTHVSSATLPIVQTTTNGGTTWTTVGTTTNYLTQMTGHTIGGGSNPNPTQRTVSFTLDTPQSGINGIRVIGTEGGTASLGFLGISELDVVAAPVTNHAPVLADTSFNIAENAVSGAAVGTVTATDPDGGDMISYTITGGNTGNAFSINSGGDITTAITLDYESLALYTLQITATDDGSPQLSDTATVTITINNVTNGDDSDGDGLNDDFESTHFPDITSETGTSDPDGDGYDNAHELAFAGDPNLNDSQKHSVIYKPNPSNNNFMLSYRRPQDYAAYGLSYKLMSTTDLGVPWTEVTGITPTTQTNADSSETVTYDIPPNGTIRFYKIEAN